MNKSDTAPPPMQGDNGDHHFTIDEEEEPDHHRSALHQDEYSQYANDRRHHDPHNHESALAAGGSLGSPGAENDNRFSNKKSLNPFKARKKNRLTPGADGRRGCSHPRKTPYRSEIGRLRHAQQLEREKGQFSPGSNNGSEGRPDPEEASANSASNKSLGIKETTAPPETAFFSVQWAKSKHSILHSLGEFLTSAFADDEESSGSYFSQDLLDQISASNPYLKGVWLQAKNLNDAHVQQLCDALVRNKVVTEVWLPSNQITDVGAGHIAHMLKFNKSIKELFLGENDIGPKGAAALASALARGNTTLIALGLGDNHIGVEGAGAFAAALRHNHSLHTLDVKNNGIPKKSSIRGLLNKMLEFNASDPGDESLVLGLQEELANLVASLPPELAEEVVLRAEGALKQAMLCRKRGDKIGAAEAEGVFIRICTTGEPPVDPPEEMGGGGRRRQPVVTRKKKGRKPLEPDRVDELNEELSEVKFNEPPEGSKEEEEKVGGDDDKKDVGLDPEDQDDLDDERQKETEIDDVEEKDADEGNKSGEESGESEEGDGADDETEHATNVVNAEAPSTDETEEEEEEPDKKE